MNLEVLYTLPANGHDLWGCNQRLKERCLPCFHHFFEFFFSIVFGSRKHENLWDNQDHLHLVWVMTFSLVAPFFAISSHTTFILVSWLTNTAEASSVALICFAVLVFFFFMFRQCYNKVNVKVDIAPQSRCWCCYVPF